MKRKLILTIALCLITAMSLGVIAYGAKQQVPAPVAENLEIETIRNTAVNGQLKAVSNTNKPLSFEITTEPNKGVIVLEDNGEFVYTPNQGKKGSDYFGYKAIDCEGNESAEATVIIRIRKPKTKVCYADMAGNGAEYAAIVMAERGVFTGECLGGEYVFSPEAAVMLDRALQLTDTAAQTSDVAPEWAAQACANLDACNIVKSGGAAYGECLNRADCAQLLLGAMKVLESR